MKIEKGRNRITIWFSKKKFSNNTSDSKLISIHWAYAALKNNTHFPRFDITHNGAKRKNGDTCLDTSLRLGYLFITYTDFDLQKLGK